MPWTATARSCLDALTLGDYQRSRLLREAYLRAKQAPQLTGEILSVLDHEVRREQIGAEEYRQLKSALDVLLVNGTCDVQDTARAAGEREGAAPLECTEPVAAARQAPGASGAEACPRSDSPATQPVARAAPISQHRLSVGETLRGRYRITGIVGHGGMGTVYEVIDQYLTGVVARDRRLAVKLLHAETMQPQDGTSQLLGEFLNLRVLSHPNIVRVHEFDREGDREFFTMELLEGASLDRVIAARGGTPLAMRHAQAIVQAVGMALAHAHSRGIVHGDVNPKNIFLTLDGQVRVLDFGASHRHALAPSSATASTTRPQVAATLRYASCEVLEGHRADAADDLFALACVAYVVFSNRHPFGNRTALEARAAGLRPARPRGVSARQWRALRHGLEWRPHRRSSDIARWVLRLNAGATLRPLPVLPELMTVQPKRRRTARIAGLAAALTLLAAGSVWVAPAHEGSREPTLTALTDMAAALMIARGSFVQLWNEALRSALIGDDAPAARRSAPRSQARPHHRRSGESSVPHPSS